jgi:hypothetical protein
LDLRRLRHLRFHLINALVSVLHQARQDFVDSGYADSDFHRASPTCPQIKHRPTDRADDSLPPAPKHRAFEGFRLRCESPCCLNGMSGQLAIASNAGAPGRPSRSLL